MDNKSGKMWEEAVVAHFDKLFGSLLEITKKSCQQHQSRYAICEPSLEPVPF